MSQDEAASWGSVPLEQSLWPHCLDCNDLSQEYEGVESMRGEGGLCSVLFPHFI